MTQPNPQDHASVALSLLSEHAQQVESFLLETLGAQDGAPPRLMEAIRYSTLGGGKRLRPALVLESARVAGAWNTRSALAAAGAIELIHTFSLVHDDLPAMDNDDLRRGRPTNHKVFGEAMAILAGDAMVSLAFELLATEAQPEIAARLVAELALATGPLGMIGGQVLDMEGEGKSLSLEQLKQLHRMKTGALLQVACRMGGLAAQASDVQMGSLSEFGRCIGLAFQIVDDLLDVTATPEQMGKATGKDAAKGKNTYPALLGLDGAKQEAQRQLQAALDALKPLGPHAEGLRCLARFVVEREC